jgi:hypothetical protein
MHILLDDGEWYGWGESRRNRLRPRRFGGRADG